MALQNRVTPTGEIIATTARGSMMGNRGGCFHRPDGTLLRRHWASRTWICCLLSFKGRHRAVMSAGRYTELFFLDEATALAAGHRPCFECRRRDAVLFQRLWAVSTGLRDLPRAHDMDVILHAERLDAAGGKRFTVLPVGMLPDGAMYRMPHAQGEGHSKDVMLVSDGGARLWSPTGYGPTAGLGDPAAQVEVLTPPTILRILRAGYAPAVHASVPAPSDRNPG